MLNYFNPNNTMFLINRLRKFVFALFIIVLLIGLFEALILSPEDYKQSDSVRIMYVHVPSAWISLGIFSAGHFSSTFLLTIFNTPPRFKPGESG